MHQRSFPFLIVCLFSCLLTCIITYADNSELLSVQIQSNTDRVGMGRNIKLTATVTNQEGAPAEGVLLLPYVNGARWGSHEWSDSEGKTHFHFPLPNPGIMEIQVEVLPDIRKPTEKFIWTSKLKDQQTIYLQRRFSTPDHLEQAKLWIAVDELAKIYVNGKFISTRSGWNKNDPLLIDNLTENENILSLECSYSSGLAGVMARLEMPSSNGLKTLVSNQQWNVYEKKPDGWPLKAKDKGQTPHIFGDPYHSVWSQGLRNWPNVIPKQRLFAGHRTPKNAVLSEPIQVSVDWRPLQTVPNRSDRLVGMQWEPWFTPQACNWASAHAVPVMGYYWSYHPDVCRQHMIWLIESGVDFLIVDWTNHLWGKEHWDERHPGTNTIIHATTLALETLARLRDEGHPVPKMVLFPGLNNGPETTTVAISEELDWIFHNYIRNPRFNDLFLDFLGKPLIIIHNGGGPDWIKHKNQPPIKNDNFTIRWQSSQHEHNKHHLHGFWSWMDGSLNPPVTMFEGKPEALTISTAFFPPGGWRSENAYGRRNGWTYIETFKAALKHKPRFIQLHQFQEYAGQWEGGGYGPEKDIYVDSYSVEMSDDIEPTSLTAPGYRGEGGWGYYYLNLTRALVDLYHQEPMDTTVLALASPSPHQVIMDDHLKVEWNWVGKAPQSFSLALNGDVVQTGIDINTNSHTLNLSDTPDGKHHLELIAEGTNSRYHLSYTEDSLPLKSMKRTQGSVDFILKRTK